MSEQLALSQFATPESRIEQTIERIQRVAIDAIDSEPPHQNLSEQDQDRTGGGSR